MALAKLASDGLDRMARPRLRRRVGLRALRRSEEHY